MLNIEVDIDLQIWLKMKCIVDQSIQKDDVQNLTIHHLNLANLNKSQKSMIHIGGWTKQKKKVVLNL